MYYIYNARNSLCNDTCKKCQFSRWPFLPAGPLSKKKNGLGIFRGRLNKGNVGNEALDRHTGYVSRALRTQAWNPGTGEDT